MLERVLLFERVEIFPDDRREVVESIRDVAYLPAAGSDTESLRLI